MKDLFICFFAVDKIEGNGRNELFYFEKKVVLQVVIADFRNEMVFGFDDVEF